MGYPKGGIFNLWKLKKVLTQADAEPSDYDPDVLESRVYLGSVFSLTPSGKYYMPWACSNLDPCTECEGTGRSSAEHKSKRVRRRNRRGRSCRRCGGLGSVEAFWDEVWREKAEEELESIGAFLEAGEGDPCDVFAVMVKHKEEEDKDDDKEEVES